MRRRSGEEREWLDGSALGTFVQCSLKQPRQPFIVSCFLSIGMIFPCPERDSRTDSSWYSSGKRRVCDVKSVQFGTSRSTAPGAHYFACSHSCHLPATRVRHGCLPRPLRSLLCDAVVAFRQCVRAVYCALRGCISSVAFVACMCKTATFDVLGTALLAVAPLDSLVCVRCADVLTFPLPRSLTSWPAPSRRPASRPAARRRASSWPPRLRASPRPPQVSTEPLVAASPAALCLLCAWSLRRRLPPPRCLPVDCCQNTVHHPSRATQLMLTAGLLC